MKIISLFGFLALVYAISLASSVVTMPAVSDWYQTLNKPFWTPPDKAFGPVWMLLYGMIALSGWLVWQRLPGEKFKPHVTHPAMRPYWLQLLLNLLWSMLFFGLQQPLLGAVDIVLLIGAIAWTIHSFYRIHFGAAWLLIPYLLWVIYAASLNIAIVYLN